MEKYTLRFLNQNDYKKLAEKYPKKIRQRILSSKGFTDMKRNVSFVKSVKDKADMIGTAFHELVESIVDISPHEEMRLRFKGDSTSPSISYSQSPEYAQQMDLFNQYQVPYMKSQQDLYNSVYNPSSKQLGGILQQNLTQPLQLPEDVWNKVWQSSKEKIGATYDTSQRQLSQRLASTGALNSSGQTNKAFQNLDYQKNKSIETAAIDQAIQEWTEKKTASQQSISNMQNFLHETPSFNIAMPQSNANITNPQSKSNDAMWSEILAGIGGVAALSAGQLEMIPVLMAAGAGAGQLF